MLTNFIFSTKVIFFVKKKKNYSNLIGNLQEICLKSSTILNSRII
jgi:hypothetical protein